jgi:hypothetical protein
VKRWLLIAIAPVAFVSALYWVISKAGADALPVESYASRAEAEAHGAFSGVPKGWMPGFIPEGATALHAVHNASTRQTWGAFVTPHAGWFPPLASKSPPGDMMLAGAPVALDWWPEFVRGNASSSDLVAKGFRFAFLDNERSPVIVAVRGTEVYWWRLARQ